MSDTLSFAYTFTHTAGQANIMSLLSSLLFIFMGTFIFDAMIGSFTRRGDAILYAIACTLGWVLNHKLGVSFGMTLVSSFFTYYAGKFLLEQSGKKWPSFSAFFDKPLWDFKKPVDA